MALDDKVVEFAIESLRPLCGSAVVNGVPEAAVGQFNVPKKNPNHLICYLKDPQKCGYVRSEQTEHRNYCMFTLTTQTLQ